MVMPESFGGDKKVGESALHRLEKRFIAWAAPRVPKWIETYHLTLMTIPISVGLVLNGYLARGNTHWFWLSSVFIALQWLTDSLDGAVGRLRNTGLIRWGYYMDHFLDYVFLCAILIGYMVSFPDRYQEFYFFLLAIFGAIMVNSFLAFGATNQFRISHLGIGPTEIRIGFIFVNALLAIFGRTNLVWLIPYIAVISMILLIGLVYRTQKPIWEMDMEAKNRSNKQK